MASNWSELPKDLLELIAKRLSSYFDILRFRCVCSSWRSSLPYSPRRLPGRFPIIPEGCDGFSLTRQRSFFLSKRTIYRLGLPEHRPLPNSGADSSEQSWLVKVEEDVPEAMHLLNPLSKTLIKPLPTAFPKVLNLLDIRISELGQEYVLQFTDVCHPFLNYMREPANLYMEKVAFFSNGDDYLLMTIHVSGKLAMFKSENKKWTIIDDLPSPYDDVIRFKGQFYAVDTTGRTVAVDHSPIVTPIAGPVFGGDKKYLVESEGELFMVDIYLSTGPEEVPCYACGYDENDTSDRFNENIDSCFVERRIQFEVFKLDEDPFGQKWVEVNNLGDRILFLGDNCSFSASALDFSGCIGNCIYFTDNFYHPISEEDDSFQGHDIGVFNLADSSIGPLASYPGYSRIFWPPPSWVT